MVRKSQKIHRIFFGCGMLQLRGRVRKENSRLRRLAAAGLASWFTSCHFDKDLDLFVREKGGNSKQARDEKLMERKVNSRKWYRWKLRMDGRREEGLGRMGIM